MSASDDIKIEKGRNGCKHGGSRMYVINKSTNRHIIVIIEKTRRMDNKENISEDEYTLAPRQQTPLGCSNALGTLGQRLVQTWKKGKAVYIPDNI